MQSLGDIKANNLTGNGNSLAGAWLDNCQDSGGCTAANTVKIILTGHNYFNDSNDNGLVLQSAGDVIMENVTADNNLNSGVLGFVDGDTTISCSSMTNNGDYGIEYSTTSIIDLSPYGA